MKKQQIATRVIAASVASLCAVATPIFSENAYPDWEPATPSEEILCIEDVETVDDLFQLYEGLSATEEITLLELADQLQGEQRSLVTTRQFFSELREMYPYYNYNYEHNSALTAIKDYALIYGQAITTTTSGVYKYKDYIIADETLPKVGCEIIASYNVLNLLEEERTISEVIRDYEWRGYLMGSGGLGSDPFAFEDYMDTYNLAYITYENSDFSTFEAAVMDNLARNRIYVFSVWNASTVLEGLHTFAFETKNGEIYAYNYDTTQRRAYTYASLEEMFGSTGYSTIEDRFIVGYIIP